jgi:leucine zipper transcription factor-like protein 1
MANDEQKGKTEDSGDLGLNAHHEDQLIQFLRFSRYQRAERLRSVIGVFADTKKTRLTTDVAYTREEVERLLTNLETVLVADIESELINASHTSLLLYRQLCAQAEHWHLRLFANLSELENRQLLDAVHVYERQQFADLAAKKNNRPQITTGVLRRLEPIENYAGAAPLLQTEIDRLRDENERMRKRIKTIESGALDVIAEKTELQQKLAVAAANTIVVVEREPSKFLKLNN